MPIAIQVENLAKQYKLGAHTTYTLGGALGDAARWTKAALRDIASGKMPQRNAEALQTLWALRDVSFSINSGEIVGIVGRNGNGKSTLLKILSRITMPTRGRVEIHGSVASLLEVGTGFHPELTGRENVYLNGAIMGMSHRQIRSKLDEIVAFSEVEKFLDTPVKRYSSGMYVRLAFAVAAHLDPEILLVDEVLAVGDGAFQKKCLGKIRNASENQRTVLFVSHSLPAVRSICNRVILLDQGKVLLDGPTDEVLKSYNKLLQAPRKMSDEGLGWRLYHSNGAVRVSSLTALDGMGETWNFKQGRDVQLRVEYEAFEDVPSLGVYLALTSLQSGEVVTTVKNPVNTNPVRKGTTGLIEICFPKVPLRSGDYALTLSLGDADCEKKYDHLDHHQNLPWLSISSEEKDLAQMAGYFSIPSQITAST
ncbi:ABC transporter ATP-binding protein [bacterium]|nr:ABC transporter ATP-binding protein [bacterium]